MFPQNLRILLLLLLSTQIFAAWSLNIVIHLKPNIVIFGQLKFCWKIRQPVVNMQ